MTDSKAAPPPAQIADAPSSSGSSGLPAATARKKLTAKQQAVFDLARPKEGKGKTRKEIGAILGISPAVVSKTLQVAYRKLGMSKKSGMTMANAVEISHPEKAAALIDASTDVLDKTRDKLRELGLPPAVAEGLIRRLKTKYFGAVTEVRNLKRAELSDMIGKKIHLALSYMDDKVMAEASYRDLALGTAALIEKKQLVDGQPTQILSDHERAKVHQLVPALLQEAKRRGLTIEGEVTEKTVAPA